MGISCSVNSFPFFLSLLMVLTSRKIYLIALHPLKLPYNKAKAEREKDKIKKSFLKIPESISVKKVKFHSPLKVTKRKLNQRKITKIIIKYFLFFDIGIYLMTSWGRTSQMRLMIHQVSKVLSNFLMVSSAIFGFLLHQVIKHPHWLGLFEK